MKKLIFLITFLLSLISQISISQNKAEMLVDINPGGFSSSPSNFYSYNNSVYFSAKTNDLNYCFWSYNEKTKDTTLLFHLEGSTLRDITYNKNIAYLHEEPIVGGIYETDIYIYNLDSSKCYKMQYLDSVKYNTMSQEYPLGDLLFFSSRNNSGYYNLFVTNGTNKGTQQLTFAYHQLNPIPVDSFNGRMYFKAMPRNYASSTDFWVSDGTVEGTQKLQTGFSDRSLLFSNNHIIKTHSTDTTGSEPFLLDTLGQCY